ncbi:microcin C transport system permease protein [Rubrimonas cliftonensis]|uniref:Microcin C transport system permease protein n=1 Tax=Rubrimonas cliftonensis TaxID=89524 RepID=A0A1H4FMC1_9RHOB|nr:ABC transporter permease [Rubrimonas cliftonensis]SEA98446.1 microcin C transport system permease protein [Rubrimonas cliftonensis]
MAVTAFDAGPARRRWLPRVKLDALQRRRLDNFRANRRGLWSLRIFLALFTVSLFAEVIANDRPLLMWFDGGLRSPMVQFISERDLGGFHGTEADFRDPYVRCLVRTGGDDDRCFDDETAAAEGSAGWMLMPLIPFSYDTINYDVPRAPSPPDAVNWLGTDDQARDVLARVIYGFRLSVFFALIVTVVSTLIGVVAGAVQGFFGGWTDLIFQRVVEIWTNIPSLYIIMIVSSVIAPNFWIMVSLVALFSWTALVGVVRAEFLRARNFEYVMSARALGVSNVTIMFRHLLPNAMVATITMLPFLVTGGISTLAALDLLGFGLQSSHPSLGELALQGRNNIQAPWLGVTAFFTFAIMLSLLVFVFEAVRDAFDPRKAFS